MLYLFSGDKMSPIRIVLVLLATHSAVALLGQSGAQTPAQRYRRAEQILKSHTNDFFLHDDSAAGIHALEEMWTATADAAIRVLADKPGAAKSDIDAALCGLWNSSAQCSEQDVAHEEVIPLGPHLFLVSCSRLETGTVFIVGFHREKPSLLWSISNAMPQERDPRGLVAAWRSERAGQACQMNGSEHEPRTCGPLYASVGALPSDALGRPRFYVDAGYAQEAGATIGKQSSVWRWNGATAELLWIGSHNVMVEQELGIEFEDGVLTVGEKEQFRSFFSCGSCEARQMAHRIRITPSDAEDLGRFSTTPELDLVDELFWRLATGRETADIASPQVSQLLKPQIAAARDESQKIDRDYFTTGMLADVSITQSGGFKHLCFTVDGEIGRLYFTIETRGAQDAKLIEVTQPSGGYGNCAEPAE